MVLIGLHIYVFNNSYNGGVYKYLSFIQEFGYFAPLKFSISLFTYVELEK